MLLLMVVGTMSILDSNLFGLPNPELEMWFPDRMIGN